MEITAIGDANIDILTQPMKSLPRKDEQKFLDIRLTVGGGAANFALQAARLGLKTRLIGLVGEDSFGKYVKDSLEKNGVECCLAQTEKEGTGVSLGMEFADGKKILLTHPGTNRIFSIKDFSLEKIEGEALHLAGYNLLDNFRKDVPKVIEYASDNGMLISIDPDLKSGVNFDKNDFFKLLRKIDILFVNDHELKLLTGKNIKSSISFLLGKGLKVLVVKLGKNGCMTATKFSQVNVRARRVSPKSSTGAGDIFDAAFVFSYLKSRRLKSTCEFANSMAVRSITRPSEERFS